MACKSCRKGAKRQKKLGFFWNFAGILLRKTEIWFFWDSLRFFGILSGSWRFSRCKVTDTSQSQGHPAPSTWSWSSSTWTFLQARCAVSWKGKAKGKAKLEELWEISSPLVQHFSRQVVGQGPGNCSKESSSESHSADICHSLSSQTRLQDAVQSAKSLEHLPGLDPSRDFPARNQRGYWASSPPQCCNKAIPASGSHLKRGLCFECPVGSGKHGKHGKHGAQSTWSLRCFFACKRLLMFAGLVSICPKKNCGQHWSTWRALSNTFAVAIIRCMFSSKISKSNSKSQNHPRASDSDWHSSIILSQLFFRLQQAISTCRDV